jgi:hypothetical protein
MAIPVFPSFELEAVKQQPVSFPTFSPGRLEAVSLLELINKSAAHISAYRFTTGSPSMRAYSDV